MMTFTLRPATPADHAACFDAWLTAVRATHHFLAEADIQALMQEVGELYLPAADLVVAVASDGAVAGFMGLGEGRIDALFVGAAWHGQGAGRQLVEQARAGRDRLLVDVNEQNPGACAFYARLGFRVVGRSAVDDAGRPFPLLHLEWRNFCPRP